MVLLQFSLCWVSAYYRRAIHESGGQRSERHDAMFSSWNANSHNPVGEGLPSIAHSGCTLQDPPQWQDAFIVNCYIYL